MNTEFLADHRFEKKIGLRGYHQVLVVDLRFVKCHAQENLEYFVA
jgi:hypothetical protein